MRIDMPRRAELLFPDFGPVAASLHANQLLHSASFQQRPNYSAERNETGSAGLME